MQISCFSPELRFAPFSEISMFSAAEPESKSSDIFAFSKTSSILSSETWPSGSKLNLRVPVNMVGSYTHASHVKRMRYLNETGTYLGYDCDPLSDFLYGDLLDVITIYQDLPTSYLYNSTKSQANSALSSPCPSHNPDLLPGLDLEGQVPQDHFGVRSVLQRHLPKLDMASFWVPLGLMTKVFLRDVQEFETSVDVNHPLFNLSEAANRPN